MVPYFLIYLLLIFLLLCLIVCFLWNNPFIVSFLDLANPSWQLSDIVASLLLCSIHFERVLSSGTLCISLPWSSSIKCCSSLIIIYWHLVITFWFILSPAESKRLTSSNPLPSAILLTKLTKLFRLLYTTLCYCCIGIRVKIYT